MPWESYCRNTCYHGYLMISWGEISMNCRLSILLIVMVFTSCCKSRDVLPQKEKYSPDYNIYHNLTTIVENVQSIVQRNPSYFKVDWSYTSKQNRPQMVIRMTNFTDSHRIRVTETIPMAKVKILMSFGEHAREFLPIESMFYLLKNITSGLTMQESDPAFQFSRLILSKVDLFIVAMMNPDGRQFVENTKNYCWRGTSTGVDLNRNFDWNFGAKGSSDNIKDEEYRGTEPFSEPECRVLIDLTTKFKFEAFVSYHSGIRQIYVPYADSASKQLRRKPENIDNMFQFAQTLAESSVHKFTYGLAYQLNKYTADGTIFDYMAGKQKIPFSFAIELWGNNDETDSRCFDLFNPISSQLHQAVAEIHPLHVSFLMQMIDWKDQETLRLSDPATEAPSLMFGVVLLCTVIVVFALVIFHSRLPTCLRLYPRRRIVSIRSLSSTFSHVFNHKLST